MSRSQTNSKPCGGCHRLMPTKTRAKVGYCCGTCRRTGEATKAWLQARRTG